MTFVMWFFQREVESIIEAWHMFTGSYDKTSKILVVSSYELVKMCQASMVDEFSYAKHYILKILEDTFKLLIYKVDKKNMGFPSRKHPTKFIST